MSTKYYLGIDVGGSNVRMGIVDENKHVYEIKKVRSEEVSKDFKSFILEYYQEHVKNYPIQAIAIGFPGVVDDCLKHVINIPNQHNFETKTYIKELMVELNIPVYIDKDVNHLLVYDMDHLNIHEKNVVGFYVGTGFGNSILLNNQIFYGDNSYSGEIGHIPILGNHRMCGCGKIGCVESLASGVALHRIHQEHFKETAFDDIFVIHKNDPILQEFVEAIAYTIATEMVILDVNTIVVGGGVIHKKGFPKEQLEDIIKAHLRAPMAQEKMKVYYSKSETIDGIIGASLMASLKEKQSR